MPRSLRGEAHALGLVGAFLIFGCGPNVQLIYEGNVRFEHCYRLDLDPSIAPPHRKACWKDYLARHKYAQTGDRLGYANLRLDELEHGQQATLALALDGGVAPARRAETVPMPSSIHAAPPARAPEPTPALSQAPPPVLLKKSSPPVELECADECQSRWNDCSSSCEPKNNSQAGGEPAKPPMGISVPSNRKNQKNGCAECKKAFKACMQRCYR